jgi:membrane-bound ClpP family serine protease
MKKPITILLLLLVPALLIVAGFYSQKDIFYSLGAVVLIFYIIMTMVEKFRKQ